MGIRMVLRPGARPPHRARPVAGGAGPGPRGLVPDCCSLGGGSGDTESSGPTRLRLLAEIREKARRLFKGKETEAWLRTPNPVLGGRTPLERLRAPGGLEEVRDLLGRIEWGIPT